MFRENAQNPGIFNREYLIPFSERKGYMAKKRTKNP